MDTAGLPDISEAPHEQQGVPMIDSPRTLQVAEAAARAGGAVLARYFGSNLAIGQHEQSHNLVSVADLESEQAIAGVIQAAFPAHSILGEESHAGDLAAEHLWVVDPLDGTNNFLHGIKQFAVSVAYYHRGAPVLGVIFDPFAGDLYTAVVGQGARVNGARRM